MHFFKNIPAAISALVLGLLSLLSTVDNAFNLHGMSYFIGICITTIFLLLISCKYIMYPRLLQQDLKHAKVGAGVSTLSMSMMLLSVPITKILPVAGDAVWLIAIILHIIFLIAFIYYRTKDFRLSNITPSWFVPFCGILIANVSFSGNPVLEFVSIITLSFGMLSYSIMLPMMIYRFMFADIIPDTDKTTIAIMASPSSLAMLAYLSFTSSPSPIIISILFGISILMTVIIYISFFTLLRLPFSIGYASFTFPIVVGPSSILKLIEWLTSIGISQHYINQLLVLVYFELIIATIIVLYVLLKFFSCYIVTTVNK